jgi:hypothetical protein
MRLESTGMGMELTCLERTMYGTHLGLGLVLGLRNGFLSLGLGLGFRVRFSLRAKEQVSRFRVRVLLRVLGLHEVTYSEGIYHDASRKFSSRASNQHCLRVLNLFHRRI